MVRLYIISDLSLLLLGSYYDLRCLPPFIQCTSIEYCKCSFLFYSLYIERVKIPKIS
jgi:hypothetical protein